MCIRNAKHIAKCMIELIEGTLVIAFILFMNYTIYIAIFEWLCLQTE